MPAPPLAFSAARGALVVVGAIESSLRGLLIALTFVNCASGAGHRSNTANPAPTSQVSTTQAPSASGSRWVIWGYVTGAPEAHVTAPAELHAALVADGKVIRRAPLPGAAIVQWAPHGGWLALCGRDTLTSAANTFWLSRFSLAGPRPIQTHTDGCGTIIWGRNGRVFTTSSDAAPWTLNVSDDLRVTVLTEPLSDRASFSTDGNFLIVNSGKELWRIVSFGQSSGRIQSWVVSADYCYWAPEGAEILCDRWSAQSGAAVRHVTLRLNAPPLEEELVLGAASVPWTRWVGQRGVLAFDSETKRLLWRSVDRGPVSTVTVLPRASNVDISVAPTRDRVAIATETGVEVWNTTMRPTRAFEVRLPASYGRLNWSANGRYLAVLGRHPKYGAVGSSGAWVIDVEQPTRPVALSKLDPDRFTSVTFSPGSNWAILHEWKAGAQLYQSAAPVSQAADAQHEDTLIAYHIVTGNRVRMPIASPSWWASDDSALVSVDEARTHLLVQSTEHGKFSAHALLGPVQRLTIVEWAPEMSID